jgi:hypothetical protein
LGSRPPCAILKLDRSAKTLKSTETLKYLPMITTG